MRLFPFSCSRFYHFGSFSRGRSSVGRCVHLNKFPRCLGTPFRRVLTGLLSSVLVQSVSIQCNVGSAHKLGHLVICLLSGVNGLASTGGLGRPSNVDSAAAVLRCVSRLRRDCLVGLIPVFSCSLGGRAIGPGGVCTVSVKLMTTGIGGVGKRRKRGLRGVICGTLQLGCGRVCCRGKGNRYSFVAVRGKTVARTVRIYLGLSVSGRAHRFGKLVSTVGACRLGRNCVMALGRRSIFRVRSLAVGIISDCGFLWRWGTSWPSFNMSPRTKDALDGAGDDARY